MFYTGDGEDLFSLMIETVAIAFVGTFISSLLSIPFAFWAARSKNTPSRFPCRAQEKSS